jgi:hypothetical protein
MHGQGVGVVVIIVLPWGLLGRGLDECIEILLPHLH